MCKKEYSISALRRKETMNVENIGEFLKKLRKEKNLTQDELAVKMHVDRSKINRLENGKRNPSIYDLLFYSEIFQISLDELIACERKNNQNKKKIEKNFIKYLQKENVRFKKIKIIFFLLSFTFFLAFFLMISVYFFQNYNTIKIYTFEGNSSTYQIKNGLFVLSKKKMYFQIGNIEPETQEIALISKINNQEKEIRWNSYQRLFIEECKKNSFFSYKDFINGKQQLFIKIDNEEIPLSFEEEFANNEFIYSNDESNGITQDIEEIPEIIQNDFTCENQFCTLILKDEVLVYNEVLKYLKLIKSGEIYTFDIQKNSFQFESQNDKFTIVDNQVNCLFGECEKALEIYENFKKEYISKYLNT